MIKKNQNTVSLSLSSLNLLNYHIEQMKLLFKNSLYIWLRLWQSYVICMGYISLFNPLYVNKDVIFLSLIMFLIVLLSI